VKRISRDEKDIDEGIFRRVEQKYTALLQYVPLLS